MRVKLDLIIKNYYLKHHEDSQKFQSFVHFVVQLLCVWSESVDGWVDKES